MSRSNSGKIERGTVLWLALKDLRHEFLVTLNLILGTAAIIAPLLILFGIKFGTIETMRNRLLNDPRNLEIRPLSSRSYNQAWFDKLKRDERIAFAIPVTRKLASTVTLTTVGKSKRIKADLVPTKEGDPLILQNGGTVPYGHHAVLSSESAKALGVKKGDTVRLGVSRYLHKRIEKKWLNIKVDAILSPRAGFLKTIYLPLKIANQIEHFKDGIAVEELGWKGVTPKAKPVFDGLFVVSQEKIDRIEQIRLISGTGFSRIKELSAAEAQKISGYPFEKNRYIYLLNPFKNRVMQMNIKAVSLKLRGMKTEFFPWVEPMDVALEIDGLTTNRKLYAAPVTWGLSSYEIAIKNPHAQKGKLTVTQNKNRIVIPVKIVKSPTDLTYIYANTMLAGQIALLKDRKLVYDSISKKLLVSRRGYAGFRIYARGLDDVESLKKYFEDEGIDVSTQAERIHDVKQLDRYLTLIFWLIAVVGVIGGTATLSASLYSSVERKKRELSVLRLLGLSRPALFRFPLYQGLLMAIGGVLTALFFFIMMAYLINSLFAEYLEKGESFCTLSFSHAGIVLLFAMGIAVLSSTLAAINATKADPAEAMREE